MGTKHTPNVKPTCEIRNCRLAQHTKILGSNRVRSLCVGHQRLRRAKWIEIERERCQSSKKNMWAARVIESVQSTIDDVGVMRAVSLRQPWASMIMGTEESCGPKRIENRLFCPQRIPLGQVPKRGVWIALCAGKKYYEFENWTAPDHKTATYDPSQEEGWRGFWPQMPEWSTLPRGMVLGAMFVTRADRYECLNAPGPFAIPGSICWKIGAVVRLPEPLAYSGTQGLFKLDKRTTDLINQQRKEGRSDLRIPERTQAWADYATASK